MNCPKCSGPMLDVRTQKRTAKSPDYQCADQNCGIVKDGKFYRSARWDEKNTSSAPTAKPVSNGAPKFTWPQLDKLSERCLRLAQRNVAEYVKNATSEDVVAHAACLFIAASKDGVQEPTAKPVPQREEVEPDDLDEDGIPF